MKNQGNFRSETETILSNPAFYNAADFIQESISKYALDVYKADPSVNVKPTISWVNITNQFEFHHRHWHPNSFISGVLYLQGDDEDKITFFNPNKHQYDVNPTEWNGFNTASWWMPAKTGTLYLFPSSLEHMVENKETNNQRISLAFNTFFVSDIGTKKDLTELKLQKLRLV